MTNGRGIYQSFYGSPDHRLLFIFVYVPRVVQKNASTYLLRGLYMIKPTSRRTMGSNMKNIEAVTVTLNTDQEHINVPSIQTCCWKEKLVVLMLPRFQGSLQRTKPLILKPGKRFAWIYRSTLQRRVYSYSLEYFQSFLNFKRSLVLKT